MPLKDKNPVLVLGLSATGLAVARILGSHGVTVYGADTSDFQVARFSKFMHKPDFGYKVETKSTFVGDLISFANRFKLKPVLIPVTDAFIEFVCENFYVLRDYYIMQESFSPEICPQFLNKLEFYKLCEENGIPYPKTYVLEGQEKVEDVTKVLKFPMIIKPNFIHKWRKYLKGKKVLLINDENDLAKVLNQEKELLQDSILQEVIPGPDRNIYIFKGYFDRNSHPKACFIARKIRQFPPYFGSFSLAETVENEEVKRLSIEFLEKVKFKGLCGTEFKYDPREGTYKMIEINIRPQLWEGITQVSNCEVLWIAYCDLIGNKIEYDQKQINGIKFSYLSRDFLSAVIMLKDGKLSLKEWLTSYSKIKGDAIISFKDPFPTIGSVISSLWELYTYRIKPALEK
ncbi:MAG: hypothetical protein DRG25_00585 [Deltaproteobacteria bacterium]|nr:MAG: hypothetical protein DRG25_00585 [Deltaproteobacteria bacterium]